MHYIALYG